MISVAEMNQAFRRSGLTLRKDAVAFINSSGIGGPGQPSLDELIKRLDGKQLDSNVVSRALLEELLSDRADDATDTAALEVISAYDVPRVYYDAIKRQFFSHNAKPSLCGQAKSLVDLYRERLYVLQQRLSRNRLFTQPALNWRGASKRAYCELTMVQGLISSAGQTRFVAGCISQLQEGKYFLEDLSGSVELDLSQAVSAGGFFTEGSVVVAEGEADPGGIFHVRALGFPPVERKDESMAAAHGLNFFGGERLTDARRAAMSDRVASHVDDAFVFFSDVWLDRPEVLDTLRTQLGECARRPTPPTCIVLMGDFSSRAAASGPGSAAASAGLDTYRQGFAALAKIIRAHPRLMEETVFVLMPGPGDPGPGNILPRPPLGASLTQPLRDVLPEAVFTTNPCRLRFLDRDVVVFRDDLLLKLRRGCILEPPQDTEPEALLGQLASTLLQQSHVCPLPPTAQPVYWEYDYALRLYPMPDMLVLGDRAEAATCDFEGCLCVNPGSLGRSGTFASAAPIRGSAAVNLLDPLDQLAADAVAAGPTAAGEEIMEVDEFGEEDEFGVAVAAAAPRGYESGGAARRPAARVAAPAAVAAPAVDQEDEDWSGQGEDYYDVGGAVRPGEVLEEAEGGEVGGEGAAGEGGMGEDGDEGREQSPAAEAEAEATDGEGAPLAENEDGVPEADEEEEMAGGAESEGVAEAEELAIDGEDAADAGAAVDGEAPAGADGDVDELELDE